MSDTLLPTSVADQPTLPPHFTSLLKNYDHLFQEPSTLPPKRDIDHRINLEPGAHAPNLKPYRFPYYQKNEIERLIVEMLHKKQIRPSTSSFSSPVLLVKKKDGTWRFRVDYRALNKITIKDRFPIPTIDELLDELHQARYFTKLDLRSGYHQIRMAEEDIHKIAFRTHQGHYEFTVLPFGLSNAPSTFQALMNKIFQPFLRKFIVVFFDDILIYSASQKDHLLHLSQSLEVLKQNNLYIKHSKCSFLTTMIDFLGHQITQGQVGPTKSNLEAIQNFLEPKTQKDIRAFLGLTGYYRKFIKGYATIAYPLMDLLKQTLFLWTPTTQTAFELLKTN
ncbi:hypothetical protein KSP39_PZI015878 [Platanthera zijinensis]|uniref:Reverse transcriptase domain-containing protein n=1 Tax=Platanthera zijinensis TaxID=2320716 RepID=A0AAP0G1S7_9ASPA